LHSAKWSKRKDKKRNGNHSPPKNNLTQDSEENEEKGYLVPDSN
jgi:hypothetical protein